MDSMRTSRMSENGPAHGPIQRSNCPLDGVDWDEKAVQLRKVFLQQVRVDGKRGLCPLRRGDDDPLHRARRVARHIQAGKMRRLILAGANRALFVDFTPQEMREP